MSDFTMNLKNIENMKNDRERIEVSNFYVTNYLRENDCCIALEDWKTILFYDYDPWCLIYEIVEHWTPEKERKIAKVWWSEFEKINTDDYGQITEPFMFWSEGTDQFDIMEAFKDFFDIDVIEDKDFMGMVGFVNGEYLVNAFKRKREENKMKSTNNRDLTPNMCNDETDHPVVSCGEYLNFWTTEGDYDVFIIFHELQTNQHEEVCEKVVYQIMSHRKINDTKEKLSKRIQDALWALVDWEENEPCVFITHMKGSDN